MDGRVGGGLVRAVRRRVTACTTARQDLCRMAVGARPSLGAARVGAHARRCPACAAFADDVARVRRWLGEPAPRTPVDTAALARDALARELSARLARDLLARAGLAPSRRAFASRADRARLLALIGPRARCEPPWADAWRLLAARGRSPRSTPEERARVLAVAARLDPLGLDVALGHLALLERCGLRGLADAHADDLLARLA